MSLTGSRKRSLFQVVREWLDSEYVEIDYDDPRTNRIDWLRSIPFLLVHLCCLGVFWVGFSWTAVAALVISYFIRMFFITGFYHRYFSHRTFKTSRAFQFIGALSACSAAQKGPLWWAAHHRRHHAYPDEQEDPHSPVHLGLFWSHIGWFMTRANSITHERQVRDWVKFPELRFLNRFDWVAPTLLGFVMFFIGTILNRLFPSLNTSGMQLVIWGFFLSTVCLYHATFAINSCAHRFGRRRFATTDDSRNSLLLALFTLGEGWHNNHHHYPGSIQQGFFRGEIDVTYYILYLMSKLGLIWDVRLVPQKALVNNRCDQTSPAVKIAKNES